MKTAELSLWTGPEGINLPANANDPKTLTGYANVANLTPKQQSQIIKAFEIEAFDMGAEYAWRRAMTTLKESIASLGMKFVGEMLGRNDINEYTPTDQALTDYSAIVLADQLGIVNKTGALKLRHSLELLNHYFSKECEDSLPMIDAMQIVASSIQYVLGKEQVAVAVEFTKFRNRLQSESLTANDGQLQAVLNSPLFYLRTTLNILLNNIKNSKGAVQEHSLANLNSVLPVSWEKLADKDRWNVGMTYRDVVADGDIKSANGMKKALLKVKGFDYVPESLRSNTFIKAAQTIIDTHFAFNNYYNEPAAVRGLASLGTTIPAPALQDCMDAYLLVYLGNYYGVSHEGAPLAGKELKSISLDRWQNFFDFILVKDELLLNNIRYEDQLKRFSNLLKEITKNEDIDVQFDGTKNLYNAIKNSQFAAYDSIRKQILESLR